MYQVSPIKNRLLEEAVLVKQKKTCSSTNQSKENSFKYRIRVKRKRFNEDNNEIQKKKMIDLRKEEGILPPK